MAHPDSNEPDAHPARDFGFREVAEHDHRGLVGEVFRSVAPRYDLMNDLMSGGLHRLWKAAMIDRLAPRPGQTLVDLAGGTGDISRRFLARAGGAAAGSEAIICDASAEMLAAGRDKSLDAGIVAGIDQVCALAEALPLPDRIADSCTIAFGLRNVTRRADALAEARRVLKTGGHFLCLEFSPAVLPMLKPLYDLYSFRVLPALGAAVANDREAYQYLVESIRRFPAPEALAGEMRAAGFGNVTWQSMSAGIVALHSGWRV